MISSQNASGTEKICLRKTKTTWRFCFLFFSFQMQAASDLIQLWSILLSLCSAVQAAAEQLLKGGQITEEKRANLRQATIDGGPEQQTINEASPFRSAFRENTKSYLLINVSPPVSVSSKSGKCGLTFPPSSSFFLHLIIPHLCTKVHGRSRNYQPKSRGAHGDTHFMETRFRIPFLESEQTFEATQQKNGGSQHVFTQKMISGQRLVSCACISGATTVYGSCRVHPRPLTRDLGLTIALFYTFPYFRSSPLAQATRSTEVEKWRPEGRSRFLSARH